MMHYVVLLVLLFLQWTISGNVSYLVTMETLKVGVVFPLIVSSCPLEHLERLRLLVDFLIEFRLTCSSFGMGGKGLIIFFK